MAHIDEFYGVLGLPITQFNQKVNTEFIQKLQRWQLQGGPSAGQRRQTVQTAVDAMTIYNEMGFPDAAAKRAALESAYRQAFREGLPAPSPDARRLAENMKTIEAKYNVLMAKFSLLDYWQAVAQGDARPEYPDDGAHWSLHEFLQFDPLKVRPVLELIHDDAKAILGKRWEASLETWRGTEATRSMTFTKTSMSRVIKAEAAARAGAEIKGEFEMEYRGFKLEAGGEAFAGVRASVEGTATVLPTSFAASGAASVEIGIRVKGRVAVEVLDVLEAEAALDGIAGALAEATAEIYIAETGVALKASADVFAGAKLTGTASSTLKLGGRPIFTGKAEGTLSAGVGATAEAHFECDLFGKVGVGAKAGATVGLGAGGGGEVQLELQNLKWGSANLFWAALNDLGFKNKGKVWFLPVEENVVMCTKLRDAMFKMMGDLYQANEAELARLGAWQTLQTDVARAVASKNPQLAARLSP